MSAEVNFFNVIPVEEIKKKNISSTFSFALSPLYHKEKLCQRIPSAGHSVWWELELVSGRQHQDIHHCARHRQQGGRGLHGKQQNALCVASNMRKRRNVWLFFFFFRREIFHITAAFFPFPSLCLCYSHQWVCVQEPPGPDYVQGGPSIVAPVGTGHRDRHQQPSLPGQPIHLPTEQTRLHQCLPSHLPHRHHAARQHRWASSCRTQPMETVSDVSTSHQWEYPSESSLDEA